MEVRQNQQEVASRQVYHSKAVVREYVISELFRTEVAAFLKYQPYFASRDVLDLGVGAGRTSRWLAPLAKRYEGLDFSPTMVEYSRRKYPEISFSLGDIRDLSAYQSESFDFVLASNSVVSAVSHSDRLKVLSEVCRVLRPHGAFMFSAHNRLYRRAGARPRLQRVADVRAFAKGLLSYARSWRNYRRLRSHTVVGQDYSLLTDAAHDHGLLHYYIDVAAQKRQLTEAGFHTLDVYKSGGQRMREGDEGRDSQYLFFVAERAI